VRTSPAANLTGANLTGANLKRANLTNANLTNANLFDATTTGWIITGVTWSNTTCPAGKVVTSPATC
jgi:uncharacterized protein YjbI with pentapeptide repeats